MGRSCTGRWPSPVPGAPVMLMGLPGTTQSCSQRLSLHCAKSAPKMPALLCNMFLIHWLQRAHGRGSHGPPPSPCAQRHPWTSTTITHAGPTPTPCSHGCLELESWQPLLVLEQDDGPARDRRQSHQTLHACRASPPARDPMWPSRLPRCHAMRWPHGSWGSRRCCDNEEASPCSLGTLRQRCQDGVPVPQPVGAQQADAADKDRSHTSPPKHG